MSQIPSQKKTLSEFQKTLITHPDKAKFLAHINEEHQDEIAMFAQAFAKVTTDETMQLSLSEVFNQGLQLDIYSPLTKQTQTYFVEFGTPIAQIDDLKDQYIALMQKAGTKLGKKTIKLQQQSFTLLDSHYVSPHMLRLVLRAPSDTPLTHAGYAYLFDLTTPEQSITPSNQSLANNSKDNSNGKQSNDSITNTSNDAKNKPRQQCYYTLRRAWHSPLHRSLAPHTNGTNEANFESPIMAWVDVYIHGDTPGGNWARSLQVGDTLKSLREYPEKIEHLRTGQCLLIADETSLPTVARLLETWQNPTPPVIIAITNHPDDGAYLHNLSRQTALCLPQVSEQAHIHNIHNAPQIDTDTINATDCINSSASLTERIIETLTAFEQQSNITIEKVWGALEVSDIKSLRAALKTKLNLPRQNMVLKVYWRR